MPDFHPILAHPPATAREENLSVDNESMVRWPFSTAPVGIEKTEEPLDATSCDTLAAGATESSLHPWDGSLNEAHLDLDIEDIPTFALDAFPDTKPATTPATWELVEPGLSTMLLMDSPNKGQNRLIHSRGNAALTGANGAGKTTLIKAVLLFSGNPPSRIPMGEGKEKFLDYYFKRETSLVIFCYVNHLGQERLLVHFKTAMGLQARFFRCGMREDLLIDASGALPRHVAHGDLRLRAATIGISCSNSMSQADAQRVLLGHHGHGVQDRKTFGAEVAASDFSLAPPGKRMGDTAEICKAVSERKSSLSQLAESSARSALDSAKLASPDQPDLALEITISPTLASLLPNVRGVSTANAAKADFETALAAHELVNEALSWRSCAREAFHIQAKGHEASQERTETESRSARTTFEDEDRRLAAEIADCRLKRLSDESMAQQRRKNAEQKRQRGKDLQRGKAEHWLSRQTELPSIEEDIRRARLDLNELEGASAESAAQMRRDFLNEREASANREKDTIREEERSIDAEARQMARDVASERDAVLEVIQKEHAPEVDGATERQNKARTELEVEKRTLGLAGADADVASALRAAQSHLNVALEASREGARIQAEAARVEAQAENEASKARSQRVKTLKTIENRQTKLAEVHLWAQPHASSPLAVARKQNPQVATALLAGLSERALVEGRVLDAESIQADPSGLWLGLDLDLRALYENPPPAMEREAASEHAEKRAREGLSEAEHLDTEQARQVDALELALKEALAARAGADKAVRTLEESVLLARVAKGDHEARFHKSERLSKEQANARVDAATSALSVAHAALDALLRNVDRLRKGADVAMKAKQRQADAASQVKMADAARRRELIASSLAAHKESMEIAIQRELVQQGADPALILAKRRESERKQKDLEEIKNHASIAQQWSQWLRFDEPSIADDVANAEQLEETAIEHLGREKTLAEQGKAANAAFQTREKALRSAIEEAANARRLCLDKMSELAGVGAPAIDPERTRALAALETHTLISQHNAKTSQLARARQDRLDALSRCHQAFKAHSGSPAHEFWQNRKAEESSAGDADGSEGYWLEAYQSWHRDGNGESHALALASQAKSVGAQVVEFHRRLARFKTECARVDRDIGAGLKEATRNSRSGANRFQALSNLSISVECDLAELPFHGALSLAAKEHEAWMDSREPLPPEELLKSLASLLEHARVGGNRLRADLASLVGISGSVVEVGKLKKFSTKQSINNLSSNGLSYLIVLMVQLAFLNQARTACPNVRSTWSIDELRDLDNDNARAVMDLLRDNRVDLISAFPDADTDLLTQMAYIYRAETDGSLSLVAPAESVLLDARARRRAALAQSKAIAIEHAHPTQEAIL